MDLVEYQDQQQKRHFWELARIRFIKYLLKPYITEPLIAADIGSGDCFAISQLMETYSFRQVWAKDPYLNDSLMGSLKEKYPYINFDNASDSYDLSSLPNIDICFMLDVLEHIENDCGYLTVLNRKLNDGGLLLVTVPAYNFLFSNHDVFLKHYRRYDRRELCEKLQDSAFTVLDSGYFFFSLIMIRFLQKMFRMQDSNEVGKGGFSSGLNAVFAWILYCDALCCFSLSRIGIVLPGLSCWAIARKRAPAGK